MHHRFHDKAFLKISHKHLQLDIGINLSIQKQQSSSYLGQNCATTLKQIEAFSIRYPTYLAKTPFLQK